MFTKLLTISTLIIGLLLSFSSSAEQKKVLGNWDVHYIAFPSTFITPEIARQYKIKRSGYQGLINISVLDNTAADKKAQSVEISGTARNLLGTQKNLEFREIKEGDAIYYIAQLGYSNEEIYRFNIMLKQGNKSQTLKFEQKFYTDE